MSPRTGRPKVDDAKKKKTVITVRLEVSEADQLEDCCKALQMKKSDVIRLGIEKVHAEAVKAKRKK